MGQTNVPFTSGSSGKKRNGRKDWNRICFTISQAQRPVNQKTIMDLFGLNYEAFKKGVTRRNCLKRFDLGIIRHDDLIHNLSTLSTSGHSSRGVVPKFVPPMDVKKYLPSWFDLALEFEVHGEMAFSPSKVPVCDQTIRHLKTYSHTWCNYMIHIEFGSVKVYMLPKYKGHKYGLNLKRYHEYWKAVFAQLKKLLGYVPQLITIRFDLHQDDHLETYKGPHKRIEVLKEILGLQTYPVVRLDKANYPIKRNEVNIYNIDYTGNGKGLDPELISPIQESLSVSAAIIQDLEETKRLKETTRQVQKTLVGTISNVLKPLNDVVRENSRQVYFVAESAAAVGQELLQIRTDQNQMSQEITTLSRNVDNFGNDQRDALNVIAANGQRLNEILEQQTNSTNAIVEFLDELVQEVNSWREIERGTKLEILSTLKEQNKTFREMKDIIAKSYDVSFQALQSFYNRNKNSGTFVNMGTKSGHLVNINRNDIQSNEELNEEIIAIVNSSPGINTRSIIKLVHGYSNTLILATIHDLVAATKLDKIKFKNQYLYKITEDPKNENT